MVRQRGFTLLEIMLVVLLAGLAAMMVMMSTPVPKSQDSAWQMSRFRAQLEFAVADSQMNDHILGIYIFPQRWQYVLLQRQVMDLPDDQQRLSYAWQPWTPHRMASVTELPSVFQLELAGAGKAAGNSKRVSSTDRDPDIIVLPGGEVTPFRLAFRTKDQHATWLQVDENGNLLTSQDVER
ncbi:type II secretion system minor pseudopilin GspH [Prodigiosinella aquatilis]|nr:type II secretion system minor pseudopilin GspH [Prodigiosinella sp. LS101]WJV52597.1 type II secretion system minor pseudopilin GspH [Prodigiosinella sp. LS101]WJV56951.1 type II secretion system minor pseudopilin GspH [Pectobacteriaceae bacterium C111]